MKALDIAKKALRSIVDNCDEEAAQDFCGEILSEIEAAEKGAAEDLRQAFEEIFECPETVVWRSGRYYIETDCEHYEEEDAYLSAWEGFQKGAALSQAKAAIPDGYKLVPIEPDIALLASMATCLHHGFGLLDYDRQQAYLHDMRKLHNEVVGKGYYDSDSRNRYVQYIKASAPQPQGEQDD